MRTGERSSGVGGRLSINSLTVLIAGALALMPVPAAVAENRAFVCAKEPVPESVTAAVALRKVQDSYMALESMRARFRQESYLAALDSSEVSEGVVLYQRPGKMRWEYQKPESQLFVLRERTMWLFQASENQLVIDNLADVFITDLPVAFLMGLGDISRDFNLKSVCRNGDGLVFELAPRAGGSNRDNQLGLFKLLVEDGTYLPKGALVRDVVGNTTAITFGAISRDVAVPAGAFSVSAPAGADIIDRRPNKPESQR